MQETPIPPSHTCAVHPHGCLRIWGGVVLALAWLGVSAAQGQTTNYALGTTALLVGPAAGTNSVVLGVTPATGAWTATNNAGWLHLSPANQSGAGSTNVIFSYDANPGVTRTGTLTIGDQTLTVTQAGSTYIAAGPMTTLVPWGPYLPQGVAVDGAGNIYFVDFEYNAVYMWTTTNNTLTSLVSSGLNKPCGVAVDGAGNVYIADTGNGAIKEWTATSNTVITLVTGLADPEGVAVDGAGDVYIADPVANAIEEWMATNGNVTTLVSNGLSGPSGVAVDKAGNVYIADTPTNAIEEWIAADSNLTTLVSFVFFPSAVAVDGAGNVYFADTYDGVIEKWTAANNTVTTLMSSGLNFPFGVAVDGAGNIYIADTDNRAVKELPYDFVDPSDRVESLAAGNDAWPVLLPAMENALAPYVPTSSDPRWLTISGITNGVITVAFTATASNRSAKPFPSHKAVPPIRSAQPHSWKGRLREAIA